MRADAVDLTGLTIAGRYRVERLLGAGGMGTVWRVVHVESLQKYALKILHPRTASDRINVERFLREARAAASLQSRHVVRVVDAQMSHVDPKTKHVAPFLVMELLQGCNLEQIIALRGAMPPEQVVWVLQQVARALDVAHGKGIIHRDLKPENLFLAVDEDGQPVMKVCDFGIAKLEGESSGLLTHDGMGTAAGATIGTPMYMAPEQARDAANVVPATDQWAVGLIAFRALSAREYFSGATSSADLLLRIVTDPLVAPSKRADGLSPAFDAWFLRSCERDPGARWKSAGEQVGALKDALGVSEAKAPDVVPSVDLLGTAKTEPLRASDEPHSDTTTPNASARTHVDRGTTTRDERARARGSGTSWLVGVAVVAALGVGVTLVVRSQSRTSNTTTTTASTAPPETIVSSTSAPIASTSASIAASSIPPAPVASPSATPSSSATAPKKPPPVHVPTATTTSTATATATPTVTATAKPKLPSGASCDHNSDCASGICAAYTCQ